MKYLLNINPGRSNFCVNTVESKRLVYSLGMPGRPLLIADDLKNVKLAEKVRLT
jgi:hypothetical protein